MEEKIITIISECTEHNTDYLKANMEEQKLWDSFQRVEIVLALEEEFDLMFEPDEIERMLDVQAIINLVRGKVA